MDMRTLPNGQTIGHKPVGVDWTIDDLPDFIEAKYGGSNIRYIRKTDAFQPGPETEEELMQKLRDGPRTIPVFADDGETVIGEKVVGGGQAIEGRQDGTTVTYDFAEGTITTVTPDGQTTVENVRE